MKAIICDKCGMVEAGEGSSVLTTELQSLDEPQEYHLCRECTEKVKKFITKDE